MEKTFKAIKVSHNGEPSVSFREKKEYKEFLKEFKDGDEILINISSKRSLAQNALLHKWVSIIASEIGENPEAIKIFLTCKFAGCNETEIEGKIYTVPISTSKLTKEKFSEFLYNIDIWASETLNVHLPNKDSI